MITQKKKPVSRGNYIPNALTRHCLNGDGYVPMNDAYQICCKDTRISYGTFREDLREQILMKKVEPEGSRLYLRRTLRYENSAAGHLAALIPRNDLPCSVIPEKLKVGELTLSEEQREAVALALSHRLSIILGGAGSGKTTLIRAIVQQYGRDGHGVLAAPTGEAARNLIERTGLEARTVHSALGMRPDDDFLTPVVWECVGLVIVDEASMLSLEMLAGFLCTMRPDCRMVLLGDPNQLLSVGSGNVLPDLLELGVPHIRLESNHRQAESGEGLQSNVVGFSRHHSLSDLIFDESFVFHELDEAHVREQLVQEAAQSYLRGENIQVLSPNNRATKLSVDKLNRAIQQLVNPAEEGRAELRYDGSCYRHGDRVMITRNDRDKCCVNGDVGMLWINDTDEENPVYHVMLPDGRCPGWEGYEGLRNMTLAYAVTVHKAQGSEYNTILMPVISGFSWMLYRNLIYTAISRAKKKVILYGEVNALGIALQKNAPPRRSMLVAKSRMAMENRAA